MSIDRCVVNRSLCLRLNVYTKPKSTQQYQFERKEYNSTLGKPKHVCNLKGKHNATIVIYSLLGYKVRREIWTRIRYQPQLTFRIVCGENSRAQYITMLMFCPWHVFKCSCYMIGGETWTIYIVLKH